MILWIKMKEFRFGFMIHAVSFEAHFGWVGFIWLWVRAKEANK